MITRKFRLIIERNNSRFSDNSSVLIDIQTSFIAPTRYMIYGFEIQKWMQDMLAQDLPYVKLKIDDFGKQLWEGSNGMEILIKV